MSSNLVRSRGNKTSDRRAHPRRQVDILANRFVDGEPQLLRVLDLSIAGLRAHPLAPGAAASKFGGLQLQLPGDTEILTASAEMLPATRTDELRLRFTMVPAQVRYRLARFVEEA